MDKDCKQLIFVSHGAKVFGGGFLAGYTIRKIGACSKEKSEQTEDEKCGTREPHKVEMKKKKESDLMSAPYPLNPYDYNVKEGDPISSFEIPMRKSKRIYQKRNNSLDSSKDNENMEAERKRKLKKVIRTHYDYNSMFMNKSS